MFERKLLHNIMHVLRRSGLRFLGSRPDRGGLLLVPLGIQDRRAGI